MTLASPRPSSVCETITDPSTDALFPVIVVVQANAGREHPRTTVARTAITVLFIIVPP